MNFIDQNDVEDSKQSGIFCEEKQKGDVPGVREK